MQPQLHIDRKGRIPSKEDIAPVKNGHLRNKPLGGLWTSTYAGPQVGSAWVQQLYEMDWLERGERIAAWLFHVEPSARIYTIDSVEDMDFLWDHYTVKLHDFMDVIDFERLSLEYDAIHLTDHGQVVTRMPGLFGGDGYRDITRSFYGWDCESTLWFRWVFTEVTYLGEINYDNRHDDDRLL